MHFSQRLGFQARQLLFNSRNKGQQIRKPVALGHDDRDRNRQGAQVLLAIYENGVLRPIAPLALPENTRVSLSVDSPADSPADDDRAAWLAQSERELMKAWDNAGDDIFNALLTP